MTGEFKSKTVGSLITFYILGELLKVVLVLGFHLNLCMGNTHTSFVCFFVCVIVSCLLVVSSCIWVGSFLPTALLVLHVNK
jgi:hypothetical protein